MQSVRDRLEAILSRLAGRASDETVYTRLYPEAARAAADAADARRKAGVSLGPLDGTIVSIKDLFDVAGEPTTAGSLLRRTTPPAMQDAAIVRRLRQAGAVIPGKTNMTEFAFTAVGFNMHYGTPGNAADASRIPGGSSSGAGVAVGEGTSDISIGSDTGDSRRAQRRRRLQADGEARAAGRRLSPVGDAGFSRAAGPQRCRLRGSRRGHGG